MYDMNKTLGPSFSTKCLHRIFFAYFIPIPLFLSSSWVICYKLGVLLTFTKEIGLKKYLVPIFSIHPNKGTFFPHFIPNIWFSYTSESFCPDFGIFWPTLKGLALKATCF